MNNEISIEQKKICEKYGASFTSLLPGWKVGLSKNINSKEMPINGLRHPAENGTLGWYIWRGDYSNDPNFFEPVHIEHLLEEFPQISKYLGLPAGWRFQIDDKDHEDVWEDKELLNI